MGLLEYLKKILGEEEGKAAYEKINSDQENVLIVDSKKTPQYIEKTELDNANKSIKDYKKQLKDRDDQLTTLQDKVKDNETITNEIAELRKKNEDTTKKYEAELSSLRFESSFEKAVGAYKTKNPKALRALLDMEKVKLIDDGSFIGLDEQVKALKESDPYLFETENLGGTGIIGPGSSSFNSSGSKGLGEKLAKQRLDNQKASEAQSNFFK